MTQPPIRRAAGTCSCWRRGWPAPASGPEEPWSAAATISGRKTRLAPLLSPPRGYRSNECRARPFHRAGPAAGCRHQVVPAPLPLSVSLRTRC